MHENSPVSEEDIRTELARLARRMRHIRDQIARYNQEWMTLVAQRIELNDHLSLFEIDRTERYAAS